AYLSGAQLPPRLGTPSRVGLDVILVHATLHSPPWSPTSRLVHQPTSSYRPGGRGNKLRRAGRWWFPPPRSPTVSLAGFAAAPPSAGLSARQPVPQLGEHLGRGLPPPTQVVATHEADGVDEDHLGGRLHPIADAQPSAVQDREAALQGGVLLED